MKTHNITIPLNEDESVGALLKRIEAHVHSNLGPINYKIHYFTPVVNFYTLNEQVPLPQKPVWEIEISFE